MTPAEYERLQRKGSSIRPCPTCNGSGSVGQYCLCGTCKGNKEVEVSEAPMTSTCARPDRDVPGLECGYPLPCPHHTVVVNYNAINKLVEAIQERAAA